jgi:hypothetical protein
MRLALELVGYAHESPGDVIDRVIYVLDSLNGFLICCVQPYLVRARSLLVNFSTSYTCDINGGKYSNRSIDSIVTIYALVAWFTSTFVRMRVQRLSMNLIRIHVSLDIVGTSGRLASLPGVALSVCIDRGSSVIVPIVHIETPRASSAICCWRLSLELALMCAWRWCGTHMYSCSIR